MKKFFYFIALAIISASTIASAAHEGKAHEESTEQKPYKEVDAKELEALIKKDKNLVIVDTRGAKYLNGKIIKGAKTLSADKIDADTLKEIIPNKETPVVFYCQNLECPASAKAAHKAHDAGYTNIYKYPGGIEDWVSKKLPTEELKK